MNKVGLAIIGSTGIIGRVHIDAMRGLDTCRLVGIHARRQEPLRQQAEELGTRMYPTLDDALADDDVDAIVIATPHPSHMDITTRAAAAGKHVLAEKPLGVTPSEAEAQISACRDSGVKLGVLFNNRFRPEALKVRQLIDDGAIGDIYRSEMSSAMLRTQDYYDRLDWRGRWDAEGGGALLNQGIHGIDMYQWLAGMPQTVFGKVSTLKHSIEVEDYATALLGYAGGGHGVIHCNTAQAPNQQRIALWGERGAIFMDDWRVTLRTLETPVQQFIDADKTIAFVSPSDTEAAFDFEPVSGGTHRPAIDDFARAIIEDREPAVAGEDALRSQELVAAITMSGCCNEQVHLPINRVEYDALLARLRRARRLPG
ncbi:MAG: Gfo/Idh/MocA family oxidoreductase [Chloroflexi bacterium]|nr:Gfo/Idh/MocA family oxidoreductase [Chloroflexota bacterium]